MSDLTVTNTSHDLVVTETVTEITINEAGAPGSDAIVNPATMADDTYQGPVAVFTAGENLALGDVCRLDTSGEAVKADASVLATSFAMFIALEAITSGSTGQFGRSNGFLRSDALFNWTPGARLFLSTTAGEMIESPPTGSSEIVQVLGLAYSADVIWWQPQLVQVELVP